MADIAIRIIGRAGRITLTRPDALNALTHDMALAMDAALRDWAMDDAVKLVIIDAAGDRAFCAGGDIQELYARGRAGDFAYGQRFWRDEYRLNALIAAYPKPYVAFMQGFTMGGGVGISCHGSHRIVGEKSRIAMPETGIGLVPDVGGSLLLARAPGRMGEYLGTTCTRMGPGDAIYCGFADTFLPEARWPALIAELEAGGDPSVIAGDVPPDSTLATRLPAVNARFGGETLGDIVRSLVHASDDFADAALKAMRSNSPLAMACAVELIHRLRGPAAHIRRALELEYRFAFRAMEQGDFLEGIRAAVIDKDRAPRWQHGLDNVPSLTVTRMIMPLGDKGLTFEYRGETS